jgi:hypothetical protein
VNIELITWRDAGSFDPDKDNTWAGADEVGDENPIIQSVGWVVKETANNVTIAMDRSDDDQTHTRSRIPVGMIVSRQVITPEGFK